MRFATILYILEILKHEHLRYLTQNQGSRVGVKTGVGVSRIRSFWPVLARVGIGAGVSTIWSTPTAGEHPAADNEFELTVMHPPENIEKQEETESASCTGCPKSSFSPLSSHSEALLLYDTCKLPHKLKCVVAIATSNMLNNTNFFGTSILVIESLINAQTSDAATWVSPMWVRSASRSACGP